MTSFACWRPRLGLAGARSNSADEFLLALKMLQQGDAKRSEMRGSWAGAMGLTQFLPSEFYKYAVDFDGDGRRDIWHSVPDALASAAKQLVGKGWTTGQRWAYEVRAPKSADCTLGVPEIRKPIGEWIRLGFVPVRGRRLSAAERATQASLLQPEGRLWAGVSHAQQLFRAQELQLLRSLCAVCRPGRDRIAGGAAVRDALGQGSSSCAPLRSRRCSAG